MNVLAGASQLEKPLGRAVLTIGNFDGVHLGHQRIIRLAISKARAISGTAVAFTFRPHPQAFLHPERKLDLLTTYDEKRELLRALGVDVLIEEPFSRDFSTMTPERFFSEVILGRIGAQAIVVGYDFGFGRDRQGHLDTLERLSRDAGIELTVVEQQKSDSEVVSSTRIREHLRAGRVQDAAKLLGREFSYSGIVTHGDGRGRQIGFPTANLKVDDKLSLPYGVYATRASVDGVTYSSVTNVGVRPTFRKEGQGDLAELVETHILGATIDLYGKVLEVRFAAKLRDEKKFSGIDSLKAQISADAQQALRILR